MLYKLVAEYIKYYKDYVVEYLESIYVESVEILFRKIAFVHVRERIPISRKKHLYIQLLP